MTPHPAELIKRFGQATVLVVGDIMLDITIIGTVSRIAPEAPVPVVHVREEEHFLGGAGNAAANAAALGGKVILAGLVGKDGAAQKVRHLCNELGITCCFVEREEPTIQKMRVTSIGQQLVRIDYEQPYASKDRSQLLEVVGSQIPYADVIILSDYNKGTLTSELIHSILKSGKPVVADPKPENLSMFSGAMLLQPNHLAVEKATGRLIRTEEDVTQAGRELASQLGSNLLITRAEAGMTLVEKTGNVTHVPTQAREVYDVTGAGDSSIAAAALAIACGGTLREAVILANQTAGIKVGKRGTATVSSRELAFELEAGHTKIKTPEEMLFIADNLRSKGKTIVFTNGFFDILHIGHAQLFSKAKNFGDALCVAINTDSSIRRLKGQGRPMIPQHERAEILSAIGAVDYVVSFDEDTPLEMIKLLKPEIIVKGGNFTPEQVVGFDVVKEYGGKVEILPVEESKHQLGMPKWIEE